VLVHGGPLFGAAFLIRRASAVPGATDHVGIRVSPNLRRG
jgi:hypothetical protein